MYTKHYVLFMFTCMFTILYDAYNSPVKPVLSLISFILGL